MASENQYLRFTLPQRVEHWLLAVSFTILAITGLPQKFAGDGWAETLIALLGGIENVRTIHHVSAALLLVLSIYHVIAVAYRVLVLRVRWTMFPRLGDVLDALDSVRFNLGQIRQRPRFGRYSFDEKLEYWALIWGTVIMAFTGLIMWNPIVVTRWLPGDVVPAAKAAHGGEAVLAVLAILIWHTYNVHIKTFNKSILDGKLTELEMEHEHALELERIQRGQIDPHPAPEMLRRRERLFVPVAGVAAALGLVGLYLFTAYEPVAIATTPRRTEVPIFVPITATPPAPIPTSTVPTAGTPLPTPSILAAKPMPADHTGRTACLVCHASGTGPALPADHAGRTDSTCTLCHKPQ